jgi:hypothetical protein
MAKKKASHRSSSSGHAKTAARAFRVIVDPQAKPSASAKKALGLFSSGVQKAYKDLARKGVETVVIQNGVVIKGVPHVQGGRYVVSEGFRKKA